MVLYPNKLPESERVCSGICTADILCPANSSQTQQAAYKKQLFHRITDLLVG